MYPLIMVEAVVLRAIFFIIGLAYFNSNQEF
jgi:hypothetical protein